MNITESQWDKLLHATGDGSGYRTHYVAVVFNAATIDDLDALCRAGLMKCQDSPDFPSVTYNATTDGIAAARDEYRRRQAAKGLYLYEVQWLDDDDVWQNERPVWAKSVRDAVAQNVRLARDNGDDSPRAEIAARFRARKVKP